MTKNIGTIDRGLRILIGLVLIALPFISGWPMFENPVLRFGAIGLGVINLAVAMTRSCPMYSLFGLKTCKS